MSNKLIRLKDGTLLEVEVPTEQPQQIASSNAQFINTTFAEKVKPTLVTACRSITQAWQEISQDIRIESAEVEIGLSFEAEGNIFITRSKLGANLTVKLVLSKG